MEDIKNIHLAFVCPLKINGLNEGDCSSYHCDQCKHSVIDFTNKTHKELQHKLEVTNSRVCGIFKREQLSNQFIKYATISLVASSSFVFQSNAQDIKIDSIIPQTDAQSVNNDDLVFGVIINEMAQPQGGYEALYKAINTEIRLPPDYTKSGKVYLQFTIDTLGNMNNSNIIKGLDKIADREVLRVIKELDFKFIPARQRNKKVESRQILPIYFGSKKD